jgi:hypothetical protein
MIKYCMRKVFRHLSEKIRNEMSVGPRDNSECLKYYFGKYENDKSFNVPFKYYVINEEKTQLRKLWTQISWQKYLVVHCSSMTTADIW